MKTAFYTMLLAVTLFFGSCIESKTNNTLDGFDRTVYAPKYASTFEIVGSSEGQSSILVTKASWQGEAESTTHIFISRDGERPPKDFKGQCVKAGARRIVCLSSSHVALLDALGAADRVIGASNVKRISNSRIAANRGMVGEIGHDGNADYELLVSLKPDLVMLYGVNGTSAMERKLRELRIPFVYISEYLEPSPLGKAEWMVAVAELLDCREEGIARFVPIPERYMALQALAAGSAHKPKVMLNTPYGDNWFMAPASSYVARLIADAGGEYIYTHNTTSRSLPIDLETAYMLCAEADVWINVGDFQDLDDFRRRMPRFCDTGCVQNGEIYNCDRRLNAYGGNDYWESGVTHPDIVLRDHIKIFHPELVQQDFYYYRRLE